MKSRFWKQLRTTVLAVACLAMGTPAWAAPVGGGGGPELVGLNVYLEGVNRYGCLTDCGGECATFCAVLNTCTGTFIGTAQGCVENCSCRCELYECVNFFTCCGVNVSFSVYEVEKTGCALYIATGCLGSPV
jgi:hypothetical protein